MPPTIRWPGAEAEDAALNIVTFTEMDGRTTLTTVIECHTKEVRDMIIESGMEGGMQEAMDRLEQVADLARLSRR